ncbi:LysR family transcriptional regulator [Achromobacter sp. GG226]|uniref:LysR family transcriptional regulator n=1 Tax=Verticiella alkaliphila TaxID=2779529 RepID=UPI001C0AF77D|nr:LysR family transcriptional regulator [Verticiella sp. GG226]MBU4613132.1 LysR family transcriptional regulator [Verticiella sp. GG226]
MERLDCDRMFVAVLDAGSFAGAATRLGTSPAQASKRVSRLEAELGVQLITRTTRALSATEAGLAYYERIKPLLDEYEAIEADIRSASSAPSGKLRLTAPISFGTTELAPVLIAFAQAYPDIQLDVSFADRLASLVDEGFDAAVRIGKPADSSLIARRLAPSRIVVAAAPAYLAQHGTPQTPADLTQHTCIIDTNFRDPYQWQFRTGAGRSEAVTVTGQIRFANAHACLAATVAGLGIARLPDFVAAPALRDGTLVPLLADCEDQPAAVYAIYPAGRHVARKVRVLVDFLVAHYQGEAPWNQGW